MVELRALQEQIKACRLCDFEHEPAPVVWGKAEAPILQIGQAPSRHVHETQRPWNDASGRTLRQWYAIEDDCFYDHNNFYITSMAHCFPGKDPKGSGDLKPPKICAATWLEKEMQAIQYDLLILIGSYAAQHFFPKRKLTDLVFDELQYDGKDCIVLPHPSPLNRRWLKQHPAFEAQLIPVLRQRIHKLLDL